jgi:EAL domain-containing protein (putative c-di-GMP-specific phosphodiesterase class I)
LPAPLTVAVNVPARQFASHDLVQVVTDALRHSGLPAHRLEIELTESSLMQGNDSVLAVLEALRKLGIVIALDDFGTGYSSLSYLRTFPLDKLKIDRSFVMTLDKGPSSADCQAIVTAIIQLARALRLGTVAEGVETVEQRDLLRRLGCDLGQGYMYARPLDAEHADLYLRAHLKPGPAEGGAWRQNDRGTSPDAANCSSIDCSHPARP